MADSKDKHVFVSIGSRYTSEQEAFLDTLLQFLESCGVTPRVMNKTRRDYPTGSPLVSISNVMSECHEAIIVAFERKFFPSGVENRSSNKQISLQNTRYTTPWNQIEASIAFARGLPIIVLAETGLHEEGLLEQKYDWYIQHLAISSTSLNNNEVRQRLQVWCETLKTDVVQPIVPITTEWTIIDLVKRLTIKTAVEIIVVLSVVFGGGVAVGK